MASKAETDPLISCCCYHCAIDATWPACCAMAMEEKCLCCEAEGKCGLREPMVKGCYSKGQSLCCLILAGLPPNADLAGTTVPFKIGCCGKFPVGGGGGAGGAPISPDGESMDR